MQFDGLVEEMVESFVVSLGFVDRSLGHVVSLAITEVIQSSPTEF